MMTEGVSVESCSGGRVLAVGGSLAHGFTPGWMGVVSIRSGATCGVALMGHSAPLPPSERPCTS